jgi:hypothetical protein
MFAGAPKWNRERPFFGRNDAGTESTGEIEAPEEDAQQLAYTD